MINTCIHNHHDICMRVGYQECQYTHLSEKKNPEEECYNQHLTIGQRTFQK